jgi:hypothetical protein
MATLTGSHISPRCYQYACALGVYLSCSLSPQFITFMFELYIATVFRLFIASLTPPVDVDNAFFSVASHFHITRSLTLYANFLLVTQFLSVCPFSVRYSTHLNFFSFQTLQHTFSASQSYTTCDFPSVH